MDGDVDIDEPALVAAAQAGDRRALDQLLRRHQPQLWKICRRLTGNDADAGDALQDALIALVRGLPRFDGRASFATWAYRVTTNACLDELRRRRRRPIADDAHATAPDRRDDRPDVASAVTDRLSIDAALAALPAEFQAPVVLRDVLGLDYGEIAAVLEIPAGTVKSRIARGRAALARTLDEGGNRDTGRRRPTPRS